MTAPSIQDDDEREALLQRLVELDAISPTGRPVFGALPLETLRRMAISAEHAQAQIARYGRLGAVWSDGGGEIISEADLVDDPTDRVEE